MEPAFRLLRSPLRLSFLLLLASKVLHNILHNITGMLQKSSQMLKNMGIKCRQIHHNTQFYIGHAVEMNVSEKARAVCLDC